VTQRPRLVVGMSGSSAPHYRIALLETLHALGSVETHLVVSDGARRTIQLEADLDPELVCRLADVVHHWKNLAKASKGIAAAGVILNSHGHVLLVKHSYPLNWELPGGAAERAISRVR